ncbi:MAG: hypothetical protein ACREQQ_00215 [Candidatus Binatia bacterium]
MSTNDTLISGQLVRYLETTTRWYFARVRRARDEDVELSFFDGSAPMKVPRTQVESLETFLGGRERTWSRTRSQLTCFFYGREFERLRENRFREMQRTFRKAGISFHPEDWPTADTRVQLWRDSSVVERNGADPRLEALLPQWLEPFVLPTGSRDPLGLQAPAERLVNEVLPGLTVFTFRAGYYGFLTWAIRSVNGLARDAVPRRTPRREVLNAFERTLALCEFVYHGVDDDSCTLIGQRSKLRVLSGNEGDRYRVPESILKNQNSAGSFRLFATSLVSLGLAEESDGLAADGLLPFQLTPLGDVLATTFQRRVDSSFIPFALGERTQARDTLRSWGRDLCFSSIARQARYREPLLRGLLLGNSRDTEKRYGTVAHLFAEGLLANADADVAVQDAVNEEDAANLEDDVQGAGVSNLDVVLHFYLCQPREDLRPLQALSVFELLSLGLSAIFRAAVVSIADSGKADIAGLTRSISSAGALAPLWSTPMKDAKPKTVRKLAAELLETDDAVAAAAVGGALLLRLIRDPLLPVVWESLVQMAREPVELIERCLRQKMDRSLVEALPQLLLSMVERHELVSQRKNRQRWLFIEGSTIVRDDPQAMGLGLHALRFPQLGSLARDLHLREEDLRNG